MKPKINHSIYIFIVPLIVSLACGGNGTSTPKIEGESTATVVERIKEIPIETIAPTRTTSPTQKPDFPATGFTMVEYSENVNKGGSASARILTQPNTSCTASFELPSGRMSTADGLGATTANKDGHCFWFWDIRSNTTAGVGTLKITANGMTKSYSITIK